MRDVFSPGLFENKRAFVSGGSSGINLEIARRLGSLGAEVAVFSRSQDKIDAAVQSLRADGIDASGYTGDVRQYDQVAEAVSAFAAKGGGIDFVVSGAAGNFVAPAAGTVEYAGALNGWGGVVILRSQGAYHVVLAGLDQISASPGQSVAAGVPIGKMPDHVSSDPELYMEVRENGEPADPERWLKQESR